MDLGVSFGPKVPAHHWTSLFGHDRRVYRDLRWSFRAQQKDNLKQHVATPLVHEVPQILDYIDQDTQGHDNCCIVAGIGFMVPLICVNTQQLTNLACCRKPSINRGGQQLGYDAIRTKSKVHDAMTAVIPAMRARQCTVRCASEACGVFFVTQRRPTVLPHITSDDFRGEGASTRVPAHELCALLTRPGPSRPRPGTPVPRALSPFFRQIEDETFDWDELPKDGMFFGDFIDDGADLASVTASFSLDFIASRDGDPWAAFAAPQGTANGLPRSLSALIADQQD